MTSLIRHGRDLRVDLCRGLALWMIFIDHVPGNWVANLTLHNVTLCDATEAFVLLSGYAAGTVYGRALETEGAVSASAQALRRAWTLYIAHIFLFVVFAAQVGYSAAALDNASYIEEIHLDPMASEPYRALLEALLLRYQPSFLNILPMYIVVLTGFGLALPLLRRPALLLALSLALYVAARVVPLSPPTWTGGGWFFNPLAWQLLFVLGVLFATSPSPQFRRPWIIDVLAGMVLVTGFAILTAIWHRPELSVYLPAFVARIALNIDKAGLHPFRLISILAVAWVIGRTVAPDAAWMRSRLAAPIVLIGQQGLPVFCVGIFLSFLGRLAMEISDGFIVQLLVNLLGFVVLVAVAGLAAWYRTGVGRRVAVKGSAVVLALTMFATPTAQAADPCQTPADLTADPTPLTHARQAVRAQQRLRILVVGAGSTAAPTIGRPDNAYPHRMAEHLTRTLPGIDVNVRVRGARGLAAQDMLGIISTELRQAGADLVVWQTGTVEAVRGIEIDAFARTLEYGITLIPARGADVVLVTPQFSRYLRAHADLDPYLDTMRAAAAFPDVALFPRYELMQFWVDLGRHDLERAPRSGRSRMADALAACIGERLAAFIRAGISHAP